MTLPKVTRNDFLRASRILDREAEEEASVSHDWGYGYTCLRCGVDQRELLMDQRLLANPCTGNAYICRVARKIRDRFPEFWEPHPYLRGWRINPPWGMASKELMAVLDAIRYYGTYRPNQTIDGLIRSISETPDRCPILADALEEAGCEDRPLLEALRTT